MRGRTMSLTISCSKSFSPARIPRTILESSSALVSSTEQGELKVGMSPPVLILSIILAVAQEVPLYLFYILDFLIISLYIEIRKRTRGGGSAATCYILVSQATGRPDHPLRSLKRTTLSFPQVLGPMSTHGQG